MSLRGFIRGLMGAALVVGCLWACGDGTRAAQASTASSSVPATVAGATAPSSAVRTTAIAPNPLPGDDRQDIRDIHGPVALPGHLPIAWVIAGALAVVALAGGLLYRHRRRPPLPPHQRALRALEEARALLSGDPRMFSFAVSETVRAYVEEAFSLRAAHRTTEELLADLMRDQSPVASQRAALGTFLQHCDLAKFAGWSLSHTDMTAMLASADTFVRATAPDSTNSRAPVVTPAQEGAVLA